MREDIKALFPELEHIADGGLREKVIDVWVDSLTTGGWTVEELKQIPFTLLAGDIDIRFLEHVRTCARMSIAIHDVLKEAYGDRVPLNKDLIEGLPKGTLYFQQAGGGGGYGDPKKRDRATLAREVRDGIISEEKAVEFYGYVPGAEAAE